MIRYLNRWTLLASLTLVLNVLSTWHVVAWQSSDIWVKTLNGDPIPTAATDRLRNGSLSLGKNNDAQVTVDDMRVESSGSTGWRVSFTLASSAQGNDYPSLVVQLLSTTGQLVQIRKLPATGYPHQSSLKSERIWLDVAVQPGASRLRIVPAYDSASPQKRPLP